MGPKDDQQREVPPTTSDKIYIIVVVLNARKVYIINGGFRLRRRNKSAQFGTYMA